MTGYQEVINLQDSETVDTFLELQKENDSKAIQYLSGWDYGERLTDTILTREQVFGNLPFVNYAETDEYLALWQIGVIGVTLYEKVSQ